MGNALKAMEVMDVLREMRHAKETVEVGNVAVGELFSEVTHVPR